MTSSPTEPPVGTETPTPVSETAGEPGQIKLDVNPGSLIQPGGVLVRFAAVIIDGTILGFILFPIVIIGAITVGVVYAVASVADLEGLLSNSLLVGALNLSYYAIYFLSAFFYFGWFYKNKGATPGKLIFKLQVHHVESGRYIGYWHAFGRETLGKFISTIVFLLGYLMAVFHPEKRALHDLIFKTRVVRSAK